GGWGKMAPTAEDSEMANRKSELYQLLKDRGAVFNKPYVYYSEAEFEAMVNALEPPESLVDPEEVRLEALFEEVAGQGPEVPEVPMSASERIVRDSELPPTTSPIPNPRTQLAMLEQRVLHLLKGRKLKEG